METYSGYVEHIIYRNEENGYAVLTISSMGKEHTLTGIMPHISEGEFVEAQGEVRDHPIYGEQLAVTKYEVRIPEDTAAIQRYLGSGAIKGLREAMAARIVKKFGEDTLRIMEEEPERLAEVKGISEKTAMSIAAQVAEKRDMRQAMIFLQDFGISLRLAAKIFDRYGNRIYKIMRENPYQLADDMEGVGFRTADSIARQAGILANSEYRIRSGILYALQQAMGMGHLYLPMEELKGETARLLQTEDSYMDPETIEHEVMNLVMDKKLVCKTIALSKGCGQSNAEDPKRRADGNFAAEEYANAPVDTQEFAEWEQESYRAKETEQQVYLYVNYYMEMNAAGKLHELNVETPEKQAVFEKKLRGIERDTGMELEEHQREAVYGAVTHGLFIMTGGPGTGKTTTIRAILDYFERDGKNIFLAAPTGRAAKRMSEATGREARTVHRMLELSGMQGEDGGPAYFTRDEDNPLEADVVIVDEMSMVDIFLMNALLKAVPVGTHLILVGDVDQLPSVGPGNVLKDLIASERFPVVRLTRIFRQSEGSDIVVNAHRINRGEPIDLGKPSKDFLFIRRPDANAVINACITLVKDKLPGYVHATPDDIQVMTPMRKGNLGIERLNPILQSFFNPPAPGKVEKDFERCIFREGDKVMQIRNNYQKEWEVKGRYGFAADQGMGVFNGDIGKVVDINLFTEEMTVEFDEGRRAVYAFKENEDLELAYAITIHKSQGSEYPAVVIPCLSGPRMLMNRNLLYTAVTRAKSCVCIVGSPETFREMEDNASEQRRYSGLKERIRELG